MGKEDHLAAAVRVALNEAERLVREEANAEWRVPFVPYFATPGSSGDEDNEWEPPIPGPAPFDLKQVITAASGASVQVVLPEIPTPRRFRADSPTSSSTPFLTQEMAPLSRRARMLMKLPPVSKAALSSSVASAAKASALRKKSRPSVQRAAAAKAAKRRAERAAMQAPRGTKKRLVGPRSVEARRRTEEKKMPFYRDVFGIKGSQIEKPSVNGVAPALALPVLSSTKKAPHSPSVSITVPHAAPISTPKSSLLLGQHTNTNGSPMVPWTPDPQH